MTKGRELSSARTSFLTCQGSGAGAGDLDEGRRSHKVSRLQFARWRDLSLFLLAPLGLFFVNSLALSLFAPSFTLPLSLSLSLLSLSPHLYLSLSRARAVGAASLAQPGELTPRKQEGRREGSEEGKGKAGGWEGGGSAAGEREGRGAWSTRVGDTFARARAPRLRASMWSSGPTLLSGPRA